jgi:hypothetical protein
MNETTFEAEPDSPAFGEYDLLTGIAHELGHLLGFINGGPAFDRFVTIQPDGPKRLSDRA